MNRFLFKIFLFCVSLIFFLSPASLWAQTIEDCSNGRYITNKFTDVTAHNDITFGFNSVKNYDTDDTETVELKMNIFEPLGDVSTARPLIILAFGGSFISGDRNQLTVVAEELAKKGYVVASIDYRLALSDFSNLFAIAGNPEFAKDVVVKSIADMRAAIRYLKHHARTYKIDKDKIILGGVSAGAIVALQAAYTNTVNDDPGLTAAYNDNGGLEGDTDLSAPNSLLGVENSQGILGVLNVSGAVLNLNIITAGGPYVFSMHGDTDTTVPYGEGNIYGLTIYGSSKIKEKADAVNIENGLYTVAGGNHESTMEDPHLSIGLGQALLFFAPKVCTPSTLPVKVLSFSGSIDKSNCNATIRWVVAQEDNLSYTLQHAVNGADFKDVANINANGNDTYYQTLALAEGHNYYRLKINYANSTEHFKEVIELSGKCGLNTLNLYPNPAINYVYITDNLIGKKTISVKMIDGREVLNTVSTDNNTRIDTGNLTSGIYFVTVTANGKTEFKKLVIGK